LEFEFYSSFTLNLQRSEAPLLSAENNLYFRIWPLDWISKVLMSDLDESIYADNTIKNKNKQIFSQHIIWLINQCSIIDNKIYYYNLFLELCDWNREYKISLSLKYQHSISKLQIQEKSISFDLSKILWTWTSSASDSFIYKKISLNNLTSLLCLRFFIISLV
jgi:hypothetical protein